MIDPLLRVTLATPAPHPSNKSQLKQGEMNIRQ